MFLHCIGGLLVSFITVTGFAAATGLPSPLVESFGGFPTEHEIVQLPPATRLPQQTLSQFGFSQTMACGPAVGSNSLACFSLTNRAWLGERPTPGSVTTAPVFTEDAVFFGTSKGFFVRANLDKMKNGVAVGGALLGFWGDSARRDMGALRPKVSSTNQDVSFNEARNRSIESGWAWHHVGSSEFIGKPVIQGLALYVMSASQILHAFHIETGKLIWTARVAPDATLRLSSLSLVATEREVIVGSNDGSLQGFGFVDGKALWRVSLPTKSENRFATVAAAPVVDGRAVIVSNADNVTQRLSLETQKAEWTYNFASVASPKIVELDEKVVLLGGVDGSVAALNARTGEQKWRAKVSADSSIASLSPAANKKTLLAATHDGTMILLKLSDGTVLHRSHKHGGVVGEFVDTPTVGACLTFAAPGFRCFVTMIPDALIF